jgi:hypothetical protein
MRVSGSNGMFFRTMQTPVVEDASASWERHRIWLGITNTTTGAYKQALVGYIQNATNGIDRGFDGKSIEAGNTLNLYTLAANHILSIQGKALPFVDSDIIPVGYRASTAGAYTISLEDFENGRSDAAQTTRSDQLAQWHGVYATLMPNVRILDHEVVDLDTSVFLGDSMGELLLYYSLARFAVVGGSLVATGCHNVLEPAAMGLPVITGPSQYNFQTICERLAEHGALMTVPDERALAAAVVDLFKDQSKLTSMGEAGKDVVIANRGALERIFALVDSYLPS